MALKQNIEAGLPRNENTPGFRAAFAKYQLHSVPQEDGLTTQDLKALEKAAAASFHFPGDCDKFAIGRGCFELDQPFGPTCFLDDRRTGKDFDSPALYCR